MVNSNASTTDLEEPLSPVARLFQAPNLNCHIIVNIGWKTSVNPSIIKQGLEHSFIKHPRFSSKMVILGRKMKRIPTIVNVEDHVIVPDLDPGMENPEQFVEDYISYITTIPMDLSKPLWELHLLNVKTSDAEVIGVLRVHHSVGDGAFLISHLLTFARKISDPEALPSIPVPKPVGSGSPPKNLRWFWQATRFILNTIVNVLMLLATIIFLKDTDTPLKAEPRVEHVPKRFVHSIVSLDDIKLVKGAMNVTINDVLLGMTQAALSQYLHRRHDRVTQSGGARYQSNSPGKRIRLRAAVVVNLRSVKGIQSLAEMMDKSSRAKWGNHIGHILVPLTIALQNDPLDYIRTVKATIDPKKHSFEAKFTFSAGRLLLSTFGAKVFAAFAHKVLSNTTMTSSNVAGPLEEISLYGYPIAYLAPSIYGHPHVLTTHFLSYANKMIISLAVDPNVIPDPHQLCQDIAESLKTIKDAIIERGLNRGHTRLST